jgi:hypothetical protein
MAARGAPRTTKKTAFIRAHKSTPKKNNQQGSRNGAPGHPSSTIEAQLVAQLGAKRVVQLVVQLAHLS